jgi:CRISPR-associated endonuclease Csn1
MNQLTETAAFTTWNEQYQKFLPTVPLELSKGFQKKRIDHRHHAMDALVIACATRDHVNLLNNQHAKSDNSRFDLQRKLRHTEKWTDKDGKERDKFAEFKKPWDNFTIDAKKKLEKIVVSFKQNLRVINKATNKYEKFKDGKKIEVKQEGLNWAIRKPLHKDTVFAKVSLRKIRNVRLNEALKDWKMIVDKPLKEEIKRMIAQYGGNASTETLNKHFKGKKYKFQEVDISKVEVYYFDNENSAVRKPLDTSFNEKKIKESVTDTGIQKILLNHLAAKENKPEIAFSPEGIEEMNKNIVQLNGGKPHQPILKVRIYETIGNKFQVGTTGNKKDKYVEAAKGTNLFFGIYANENGNRSYETIPLNIVIERLKQGLNAVPERNEKGHNLLFHLSPNDLVYVPTEDEKENIHAIDWGSLSKEQIKRIFVVNDFSSTCYFTPNHLAKNIAPKEVDLSFDSKKKKLSGSFDTKTASFEGKQIKDVCIKLNIDRLGNITIYKPNTLR